MGKAAESLCPCAEFLNRPGAARCRTGTGAPPKKRATKKVSDRILFLERETGIEPETKTQNCENKDIIPTTCGGQNLWLPPRLCWMWAIEKCISEVAGQYYP